jgi:trehalose 6-phosphate synthase
VATASPQIAIVSNRAPFRLALEGNGLCVQRAPGGIVNAFDPLRGRKDVVWFAVAMSDAEREMARHGSIIEQGFDVRFIVIDPHVYDLAYNGVYNGTLWPVCHGINGWAPRRFDNPSWHELWEAYRTYNRAVGEAIANQLPEDAVILAQDLYFALLASTPALSDKKMRRSVIHTHLPFPEPAELEVLPEDVAREILMSMGRFGAVGFQTQRWRAEFVRCCRTMGVDVPNTFVAADAPPMSRFNADAASAACDAELVYLESVLGGCRMLTQLDRMDPAKNIFGSLAAYDLLLERHADVRGTVVFVILAHPTRQDVAEYRAYASRVRYICEHINRKYGSPSWRPVVLRENFSHLLHVAALRRYDVLLVNAIRDGMNLIALEGPQLNERCGVSVVSPEAGAYEIQKEWVLRSDPFDSAVTAEALYRAIAMDSEQRAKRFAGLRAAVAANTDDEFVKLLLVAARFS